MTNKQFRQSIARSCKAVMSKNSFRYNDIEINERYQTVSVAHYYFAQGDNAIQLLDEMNETANKTGLNVKTCIVWYLDGAGVFQS